jgi:cytochrome bd ubiquinol oxidase subunit I
MAHLVALSFPLLAAASPADLLAARSQMALTLGFHIVLACLGVALPALMLIAEARGIRRDDADALLLARRWSSVVAVTFAVGAVSGTVLSFELGLLWPGLMGQYGAAYGIPFAVEGLFFFLEAIFVAIYIYGWDRLGPRVHFLSGIPIAIAGLGGTFAVVSANAWMNQPAGFTMGANGTITEVRPLEVIFNGATWYEVPHMLLAAYMVTGFLLASVYAVGMLRGRRDHYMRLGFTIPFVVAAIAAPIQIGVGDVAARAVFEQQPAKFAAMELVTETGPQQPVVLGGILVDGEVRYGLEIPGLGSFLAGFDTNTVVTGFDQIPLDERPPANVVHLAWDAMLACGFALLGIAAWYGLLRLRRRDPVDSRWFLRAASVAGVLAIVAMESGWVVTEVGRQPWIVWGELRTSDAVTAAGGLQVSLLAVVVLYLVLGIATIVVLRGLSRRWSDEAATTPPGDVPYGPPDQ